MAQRLFTFLAVFFLFAISAMAQGRLSLFAGYSYEHLDASPARNLHGVEIAARYDFRNWLGLAADLDSQFGLPSRPDARTLHLMVGPQISGPGPISLFVHALAGMGHISLKGGTEFSVAAAIGAGLDVQVLPLISWRAVQADDVITRFSGRTQHSPRLSTGLVFRF